MTPFSAILGGGAGGLAGGIAAQLLVAGINRVQPGAGLWLKGAHGPPFFNLALFLGVFYGLIGAGLSLSRGWRPARPTLVGFAGPFLGIAAPMALLTRTAAWGSAAADAPTNAWIYAVTAVYTAAVWSTIALLGWTLAESPRWKGACGAVAGALGGYLVLAGLLKLGAGMDSLYAPMGFFPPPSVLLDGLLGGCGIGVGIATLGIPRMREES